MRLPHQPGCHQAGCTRLAMLSVTRCNPTFLASIPRQKVQPPRQRAPHPQRVTLIVAATSDASAAQQHAVRFSLCYQAQFGQQIRLVGSSPAAGMWNPAKSLPLTWTEGDEWVLDAKFPAGAMMEYKYVVVHEATGNIQCWQPGDNLEVHVPEECAGTFVVKDDWVGSSRSIGVIEAPLPVVEPAAAAKVEEPASSRKDAEEAIAKADVGVFTYVEVLLNSSKGKTNGKEPAPAAAATASRPEERAATNGTATASAVQQLTTLPLFGGHNGDVDSATTIVPNEELLPSSSGSASHLNGAHANGHGGDHNGHTNGKVNGKVNGSNGHTNGKVNGTTNGHTNGAINGIPRVPDLLDKLRGVIWYVGDRGSNGNGHSN